MSRVGLPELLLVLAIVILIVGTRRMGADSRAPRRAKRQALIVWLFLLLGGISLWLLTT